MKIAILVQTLLEYAGPDRVAESQAREFVKLGHQVTIFTLKANIKLTDAEVLVMGMPENSLLQRFYRILFPFDIIKTIRFTRKLREYDLVISHTYPISWLAYVLKKFYGKKYVYINHHIEEPELFEKLYEKIYLKIYAFMMKTTSSNADLIISISKFAQKQLKDDTGLDSEIVYNAIDVNRFHEGIDGSVIREKHNLNNDPVILFVGRIIPYKGVHILLRSFQLVKQEFPNAKLIVIGKHRLGYYSKELEELSDSSVLFAGYVSDEELPYYYAACDVYATASLLEGFNIPIMEAQACSKPVVAFNIGPHMELVKDGETGFLVPANDIKSFASRLVELLKDKEMALRLGKSGNIVTRENFTTEKNACRVLEISSPLVEQVDNN